MPWSQHQNRVAVILAACAVVIVVAALLLVRQQPDTRGMYTTHGRQVRDPRGRPFLMHGFSRPSLEWLTMGDHLSKGDVDLMASWGANTIRIPTNQDFLLEDSCHYASTYLQTLDQLVDWIIADGMNTMIDLHWSDRNEQCIGKMGQQLMADERSLLFWQRMAEHYRQNPHVFFDLYNEPHNVTWDCWLRHR